MHRGPARAAAQKCAWEWTDPVCLLADYDSGAHSSAELMEISGLSRSAMYAALARARTEQT